jgi:uncharacterized membrane protein HdeD (DUF308 family)
MATTTTAPETFPFLRRVARDWWALLVRGLAALAFGIMALVQPGEAALVLVWLFGAFALVDGVIATYGAFRFKHWWGLVHGVFAILAGMIALVNPVGMGFAIVTFVGAYAIVAGILQIAAAWRMRKEMEGEVWIMLGGLALILCGGVILARPLLGGLSVMLVVAAFAIVNGIALILASIRFKRLPEKLDALASRAEADRSARGLAP